MRILNNREEAEDVLQEVFLQVWRKAEDFDESRGRPFTWLVTSELIRISVMGVVCAFSWLAKRAPGMAPVGMR